ncbi:actin-binding ADF family protein [Streptomyces olivaceus]|uniref:actin-binding ADF family protein n=1 Tax=Streptomyces olivaceus TaxID=47716 RepID=UPI0036E70DC3
MGMKASSGCTDVYKEVQSGRITWAIYKINDQLTEIVPDCTGDGNYEQFLRTFPSNDVRFAVYNFGEVNGRANTVVFYYWEPDSARVKSKMLYASSREQFRGLLEGVAANIYANTVEEASREAVLARVN